MSKFDLLMGEEAGGLSAAVLFDYPHVHFDEAREVVAMLSLTAPEVDVNKKRPPLNIVAAIDVSTSMAGEKLRVAKDSLKRLIDHLGSDDRLAVISFDSRVSVVVPAAFMVSTAKSQAASKVDALRASGCTNLSGAMLESFRAMAAIEKQHNAVNRIILFTDGDPSTGVRDPAALLEMLDKAMIPEVAVSTFGYGSDYKAELLSEMSKRGKGNFYFVEDIEKCAPIFGMELGGLLSTYAQNVRVSYELAEGVEFVKCLDTAYTVDGNTIQVPDVLGGETRHVLVQLKLPKRTSAACARPNRVLTFNVEYDGIETAKHHKTNEVGRINYVRRKDDITKDPTPSVKEQLDILNAARVIEEARERADHGDFFGAQSLLRSMSNQYAAFGGAYAQGLSADLAGLAENMGDARSYGATRSRVVAASHSYATRRSTGRAEDAGFLNATQTTTSSAFSTPVQPTTVPEDDQPSASPIPPEFFHAQPLPNLQWDMVLDNGDVQREAEEAVRRIEERRARENDLLRSRTNRVRR